MKRLCQTAVLMLLACAASPLPCAAQAPGRILLGGDPRVPPAVQQRLAAILGQIAPVVPSTVPPQPGDLAVIAELSAGASGAPLLRLTYYDGMSASPLLRDEMPIDGGTLGPAYDSYILGRVQNATAMMAQRGPAPMQQAPATMPPPGGAAPGGAAAAPEPEAEAEEEGGRPVAVSLSLGMGPGMHQAALPTDSGNQSLPLSTFAALDMLLQIDGVTHHGAITPGARIGYRTSIGYKMRDTPPSGVQVSSPARTHELQIDAVANINFGDSLKAVSLPLSVGWALNNSRTDVELVWPRYTLGGPHARLLLRVPIADGAFVLALGPDVQWIVQVSGSLQRAGINPTGLGFGAEVQLAAKVSEGVAVRALYREAHAQLSSTRVAGKFTDTQRFITIGAALVY